MLIGYARVSTHEQNLDLQEDALKAGGCERIYTDKTGGAKAERPGLERALADVRPGDTLVVSDDGTVAPGVLARLTAEHRARLEVLWADGKYHTHRLSVWLARAGVGYRVDVVSRPPGSRGYVKLPRRWVVERTFAWLGRR